MQVEMMAGKCPICGRQLHKDKNKCIFHLENKSDEYAKIFEIEFWKELERMEGDEDIRRLDFSSFIFPTRIEFGSVTVFAETFDLHISPSL